MPYTYKVPAIETISLDGERKKLSLEVYLDKLQESCLCGREEGAICLCREEEDLAKHLALLEEGGIGRARIIDQRGYRKELEILTRKRPVLLRHLEREDKETPF